MHIVTKFLIVCAAVLSMLLAGLTIAYTSNAGTLRSAVRLSENRATQAEAQARSVTAAAAQERESLQQKINDLETAVQQAVSRMADLQGENAKLLADNNALKQGALTHQAQIDQFTAVVQTYAALNKSQSDELNLLRNKELEYARKEIDLSDRINDLMGELEVARETGRGLQEQLVEARQALDRVQQGGTAASAGVLSAEDALLRAPMNFRSTITTVQQDPAGNTLVGIPAGSSDGLRENMKLSVVREGFLATVVLERVDQNESVGRVDFLGRQGQIVVQQGDRVVASSL
ncbi:MAG: hypothetical protein SFZ24_10945 [Planctomycetota bacterium]|nr:hypothetical protein [Planctomycetota bacterium]